ncbi:MAG: acyl-protein synthetase [Thermoplasmata archaeon]|nr:MAG: acyl-protein synthetase [Thermoplasmata archaeon]
MTQEGNLDNNPDISLEDLIKLKQYSLTDDEKNKILLKIIKKQLVHAKNNNRHISNFFEKQNIDIGSITSIDDVPPLPIQMFKYFDLATCPKDQIVKILKSSGTTTNLPSKVPLNKNTTLNQVKALNSILSDYIGKKRRIFLVIDHEGINDPTLELSARTAGVRGLSIYSKKIHYLLKEENGKLILNLPVINELLDGYEDEEVYVFGFTYIIWSTFYEQIIKKNIRFKFKDVKIFHSGGWKKLVEQQVSKEFFSKEIAKIFGTDMKNVYDFYGMAEQNGIIFVDCEYANKHIPNFSQVIVRDIQTLKPCKINEPGIIEVMSILSDSYYSQAILTEDIGYLIGIDDCACGRKGRYFRFKSRVERAEIRGCGDTFREK